MFTTFLHLFQVGGCGGGGYVQFSLMQNGWKSSISKNIYRSI